MNILRYLFIIGFIYAAGTQGYSWWKIHAAESALAQSGVNLETLGLAPNCKDKTYCITAYIAPWCGACQATEPTFRALQEMLPRLRPQAGFGLVIGASEPARHEEKKRELAPIEAYADDSGLLMKSRRVNGFPTWIVTDAKGKEISRMAGGITATNEGQLDQFLREYLKVLE
jgi:thiol-disulfide isomerase/thioredoxin